MANRLTKTVMVDSMYQKLSQYGFNLSKADIRFVVNEFLEMIADTLSEPDGVVVFPGLFTIKNVPRKERTIYVTGEPRKVPAGRRLKLKTSMRFKNLLCD